MQIIWSEMTKALRDVICDISMQNNELDSVEKSIQGIGIAIFLHFTLPLLRPEDACRKNEQEDRTLARSYSFKSLGR